VVAAALSYPTVRALEVALQSYWMRVHGAPLKSLRTAPDLLRAPLAAPAMRADGSASGIAPAIERARGPASDGVIERALDAASGPELPLLAFHLRAFAPGALTDEMRADLAPLVRHFAGTSVADDLARADTVDAQLALMRRGIVEAYKQRYASLTACMQSDNLVERTECVDEFVAAERALRSVNVKLVALRLRQEHVALGLLEKRHDVLGAALDDLGMPVTPRTVEQVDQALAQTGGDPVAAFLLLQQDYQQCTPVLVPARRDGKQARSARTGRSAAGRRVHWGPTVVTQPDEHDRALLERLPVAEVLFSENGPDGPRQGSVMLVLGRRSAGSAGSAAAQDRDTDAAEDGGTAADDGGTAGGADAGVDAGADAVEDAMDT
jgi:hypothetical protein